MADDFDNIDPKDLDDLRRILAGLDPNETNPSPGLVEKLSEVLGKKLDEVMDNCDCAGCRYRRGEIPLITDEQQKKIDQVFGRVIRSGFNTDAIGGLIIHIYALGVDNARAEAGG